MPNLLKNRRRRNGDVNALASMNGFSPASGRSTAATLSALTLTLMWCSAAALMAQERVQLPPDTGQQELPAPADVSLDLTVTLIEEVAR